MPKSIHERVRAQLAKAEKAKRDAEHKASESAFRKAVRAEERRERGILRALRTGIAQTADEQRALDIEYGIYSDDEDPYVF